MGLSCTLSRLFHQIPFPPQLSDLSLGFCLFSLPSLPTHLFPTEEEELETNELAVGIASRVSGACPAVHPWTSHFSSLVLSFLPLQ